jgi:hypothetical protein
MPAGGHVTIFQRKLSGGSDSGETFSQIFSAPLQMSMAAILLDHRLPALTGQSFTSSTATIFVIDHRSLKGAIVDTDINLSDYSSLDIFASSSELVLYEEGTFDSRSVAYDLKLIMEEMDHNIRTIHLEPSTIRVSSFDEVSTSFQSEFWDKCSSPDVINAGRAGWHCVPLRATLRLTYPTATLFSHVLDHIFDPRARGTLRHRQLYIPPQVTVTSTTGTLLAWCYPGWTIYVDRTVPDDKLLLKLIMFPTRLLSGLEFFQEPKERIVHLPGHLDLAEVACVIFDPAWGR